MWNWFDLEEMGIVVRDEISRALTKAERDRRALIQELDEARPPLRRRLAIGLIRLGERIDPLAAGSEAGAA